MTEIGMALGIPYHTDGKPGFVGIPFTSVLVRLVDEDFQDVAAGTPGEILIKGPSVFKGYWENEAATASAFHDGWFVTGDVAVQDEAGDYRIMGRRSTDILKSGGYKLSALEIEEVFRQHPDVLDCAVVGLEDEAWGEIVALAIEGRATVDEVELLGWARTHLAHYKLPRRVIWLDALPRNAMGKVVKAEVKKLLSAG
jgi:malonyl-CoA/methylmalonyl-CoA synthetase